MMLMLRMCADTTLTHIATLALLSLTDVASGLLLLLHQDHCSYPACVADADAATAAAAATTRLLPSARQVKSKDTDYYALLGLQHERWMATEQQLKLGEDTILTHCYVLHRPAAFTQWHTRQAGTGASTSSKTVQLFLTRSKPRLRGWCAAAAMQDQLQWQERATHLASTAVGDAA